MKLNNKRILVLAPSFFSYEKSIKSSLEDLGADVIFFDERPSNGVFGKAIVRLNKTLAKLLIDSYYKNIQKKISNLEFDYILIFQGEATPRWFLEILSQKFHDSRMVLYLWDSVSDKPNSLDFVQFYDYIYTFDPQDAKMYNLKFRPLFYIESYKETNNICKSKYTFSFIGTVRNDRYNILEKLKSDSKKLNYSFYVYYYLQSKLVYLFFKYVKSDFHNSKMADFHFESLSHDEIKSIIDLSDIVIDIQKVDQVGLTIRTIELLCSQKKIATTNKEILKYNFYNKNNVSILDRKSPSLEETFIEGNYEKIPSNIMEGYSLEYFLLEILGILDAKQYYNYE